MVVGEAAGGEIAWKKVGFLRENCEIQRLKALFHRLAKTPKVHLWVEMDKSPEFGCGLTSPLYWDLGSAVLEHKKSNK